MRQRNKVHYGEVHFMEYIALKPTVAMGKIAIDSRAEGCSARPWDPLVTTMAYPLSGTLFGRLILWEVLGTLISTAVKKICCQNKFSVC
jgi:hypothetical protein